MHVPLSSRQMQGRITLIFEIEILETSRVILYDTLDQQDVVIQNGASKTCGNMGLDPLYQFSAVSHLFMNCWCCLIRS